MNQWHNWCGYQQCAPDQIAHPRDEAELATILKSSRAGIRVVGAGHSFSALVPTDSTIVSLDQMTGVIESDTATHQATCWAGTSLRDLGPSLWDRGLSLPVQGDVDPQSLGGAIGTGTHGTGRKFGSISSLVVGFRLMLADGSILDCDANNNCEVFQAGQVAMGALGIMTQVRLQCVPAFRLQHRVWPMPRQECLEQYSQLLDSHRHFEVFEFMHSNHVLAKTLDVTTSEADKASNSNDDLGVWLMCEAARLLPAAGRLLQRTALRFLPEESFSNRAYLVYPSPRDVKFNEVEYAIPADQFEDCEQELISVVRKAKMNEGFPFEYRWVQADEAWLSPFYERDSAVISVHRYGKQLHSDLFDLVEPVFWKHDGRPHWGKLHTLEHDRLQPLYPKWADFCDLRKQLDPNSQLLNDHLRNVFSG